MKRSLKKPAPVRCANCTRVFETWHAGRIRCPYCSHELELDVPEDMLEPPPPQQEENHGPAAGSAADGDVPEPDVPVGDGKPDSEAAVPQGAEVEHPFEAGEGEPKAGGVHGKEPFRIETDAGWIRRFTDTLVGVMFRPTEFFSWMDGTKVWRAVGFGWLLAWLAAVVFAATARYEIAQNPQAWLDAVGVNPAENPQQIIDRALGLFGLILWTSPILGLLNVVVSAVIYHIGILLLAEKPHGFRSTLCVTAYGFAPMVMALIPGIGQLVGSMWSLWVQVLGLALVHRTSVIRSAVAVVVPSAIGVMLLGLLI